MAGQAPGPAMAPRAEAGAEAAAARLTPAALQRPTPDKRTEGQPWAADELAMRRELLLLLGGGEAAASLGAAAGETLLLQVIRGHHHESPRLERTHASLAALLRWRRGIGADAILSDPPPRAELRCAA